MFYHCAMQLTRTYMIRHLHWITSDVGGAFSNFLNQFDRLVVPGTRRFTG